MSLNDLKRSKIIRKGATVGLISVVLVICLFLDITAIFNSILFSISCTQAYARMMRVGREIDVFCIMH